MRRARLSKPERTRANESDTWSREIGMGPRLYQVDELEPGAYTMIVDLLAVAVRHIRQQRSTRSDGEIRATLASQGFSKALVGAAFTAAGPRPAALVWSAPVLLPPRRWLAIPALLAVGGTLLAVAFLALRLWAILRK